MEVVSISGIFGDQADSLPSYLLVNQRGDPLRVRSKIRTLFNFTCKLVAIRQAKYIRNIRLC